MYQIKYAVFRVRDLFYTEKTGFSTCKKILYNHCHVEGDRHFIEVIYEDGEIKRFFDIIEIGMFNESDKNEIKEKI